MSPDFFPSCRDVVCSLLYSLWGGVRVFTLCSDDVLMTCSLCRSPPWWSRWSSTRILDAKLEDSCLVAHSNIVIVEEIVFVRSSLHANVFVFFNVYDLHVTILSALHALLALRALNQRKDQLEAVAVSHLYSDLFMLYKFQLTVFELIHIASNML